MTVVKMCSEDIQLGIVSFFAVYSKQATKVVSNCSPSLLAVLSCFHFYMTDKIILKLCLGLRLVGS